MVNVELISRIDELKDQFNQAKHSDMHAAIQLADQIYQLAIEAEHWSVASKIQAQKAFIYFEIGQYAEGMVPAQDALRLALEHQLPIEEGYAYFALGTAHAYTGNYTEALEFSFKQKQIALQSNHLELLELALTAIPYVYREMEQFPEAIASAEEGLRWLDERQAHLQKATILENLGVTYHRMKDYARDKDYYQQAIALARTSNIYGILLYGLASLSNCLCELHDIPAAQATFDELDSLCQHQGNIQPAMRLTVKAQLKRTMGDTAGAIADYQSALEIARQAHDQQATAIILDELVRTYRESGDYEAALRYFEDLHKVKTISTNENSRKRHDILNALHKTAALQQEAEIQRLRKEQAEWQLAELKRSEADRLEKDKLAYHLKKEQELAARKERILHHLHHEIRTPLTIIHTATETMNHYRDRISDERRQQYFDRISDQFWRINKLMDDISAVLHGVETQPESEGRSTAIDIHQVCQGSINTAHRLTHTRDRIAVNTQAIPRDIWLDATLLDEVLVQLLTNSLKFSEDRVQLEVRATDHELVFSVADHGKGIPEEELHQIYQPLFRGSNVGEVRGLGLGLTIVRNYVKALMGKIHIDSQIETGTTVTIEVPFVRLNTPDSLSS
ncbi:MAG TPA: ATP-binding protein [Aggregatilineales bacterium]|nr:ATP-binding protein [Aggregatilineales bacterium]